MRRGFSMKALKRNILAIRCVLASVPACKKIMKEFRPDVVIGTGGYASFPALLAAHQMGIPTCVHEANAVPAAIMDSSTSRAYPICENISRIMDF